MYIAMYVTMYVYVLYTHKYGLDNSAYQVMSAKDKVTLFNEDSTTD